MQNTENYNLKKPDYMDFADVKDLNDNMDIIDEILADKLDKTGDASNAKVATATTSSASYPIPAANDTFKVILGKIIKFFGDIKAAFTDVAISGRTLTFSKADGTTKQITTQDTWNANSVDTNGYVAAPTAERPWRVWMSAANGAPGWRNDAAAYDHPGLFGAAQYRLLYNKKDDNSQDLNNTGKFYSIGSDGIPKWRNDLIAGYDHPGLLGSGNFRQLFNRNEDGTYTNTERKFWGLTNAGQVGWQNYTATQTYPGWMSAADKTKLDGIATGATVSGVTYIAAGEKTGLASSTSTITTVASKAVSTPGTYLVMMTASTASTATGGYLRCVVNTSSAWGQAPSNANMSGTGACVSSFYIYTISSSTTFRALVQQSSGAAQDVRWNFTVIRLS